MERYDYYAFISYSHKDEVWAKWLQTSLESYKLPSIIRKESNGLPKKIRPIFRDKTDITPGNKIRENLRRELESSRYLIVICSTNSAQSQYVNHEVETFEKMGRSDRIIPVIVEGHPNASNPEEECYCPALRDEDND